jgi:hypothetical protein
MILQRLSLTLDGITAGDYMTWVRDPEPPALGRDLHSIAVRADPLGDTVDALMSWNVAPPDAMTAAATAGLPLTPEVVAVKAYTDSSPRSKGRAPRPTIHPRKARWGVGQGLVATGCTSRA